MDKSFYFKKCANCHPSLLTRRGMLYVKSELQFFVCCHWNVNLDWDVSSLCYLSGSGQCQCPVCLCWSVTRLSSVTGDTEWRPGLGIITQAEDGHWWLKRPTNVPEMFLIMPCIGEMSLVADSSISQRSLIVTTPISSDVRSVQLYLANYVVEVSIWLNRVNLCRWAWD